MLVKKRAEQCVSRLCAFATKDRNPLFMKKIFIFLFLSSVVAHAQNPRLFLDSQKIKKLQTAIETPGTHHYELFGRIKARVDSQDLSLYPSSKPNYNRSYQAVENALVYLLTDSTKYAQRTYEILEDMYTSGAKGTPTIPDLGDQSKHEPGSKALTYAFPGMAYAICYDWARSGWDTNQVNYVYDSLKQGVDDWEHLFRWELYDMPLSNWNAVCKGTEVVMMLAARLEDERPTQYQHAKDTLKLHLNRAHGPSGYTYEGLGYLHYGMPFAFAGWYAAGSIGDTSMNQAFTRKSFGQLLMYTFSFTDNRTHLMTSVDSHHPDGEGLFGLVMNAIPDDSLSYYKYFYDRHIGIKSNLPDREQYDQKRLGAIWNLIYYPAHVTAKDPDEKFAPVLADNEFGAYFFRNRWNNENDILFDIMGHYIHHSSNSWNKAETFNICLVSLDQLFIGNSAKTYNDAYTSSLLVDDTGWEDAEDAGNFEAFNATANGGYVIIDGGNKYSKLGVSDAKRHCKVTFTDDSAALISTLDQLQSNTSHSYTWQINVGHEEGTAGITTTTGTENGRPYFLLEGGNGYVKGWCLNLAEPSFDFNGTSVRLTTTNTTAEDIFIVMKTGGNSPPGGDFVNNGMKTAVRLNGSYIHYNDTTNRIEKDSVFNHRSLLASKSVEIQIWPNPADEHIHFESNNDIRINEVRLVDITGRTVYQQTIPASARMSGERTINVSKLEPGVYLLKLYKQETVLVKRIVIR